MASDCLRIAWKSPKIAKNWMITGQERHYFAYSWFALKVKEVLSWRFSHDRRQDLSQYFFDKIWKTCLAIFCWICFTKQKDNHKKGTYLCCSIGNGFAAGWCGPISKRVLRRHWPSAEGNEHQHMKLWVLSRLCQKILFAGKINWRVFGVCVSVFGVDLSPERSNPALHTNWWTSMLSPVTCRKPLIQWLFKASKPTNVCKKATENFYNTLSRLPIAQKKRRIVMADYEILFTAARVFFFCAFLVEPLYPTPYALLKE